MKLSRPQAVLVAAVVCAAALVGAVAVSAEGPTSGVRSDISQPKADASAGPVTEGAGEDQPPPELADLKMHATIDGKIQKEPLADGQVVDDLGRRADGGCNPSAESYGVARLTGDGGTVGVSFALDRDRCAIVAHFDGKAGSGD